MEVNETLWVLHGPIILLTNKEMKKSLINTAFEIQELIKAVVPPADDCEWTDQGMMVDPRKNGAETVLWRDLSWGIGEEEWWCSYSTAGELKGELPEDVEVKVKEILAPYAKNAPFKYISNLDDED